MDFIILLLQASGVGLRQFHPGAQQLGINLWPVSGQFYEQSE